MDFIVEHPDLSNAKIIYAKDFGLSEDSHDNTKSLNEAILYCNTFSPCVLEIEKGIYHFQNNKETINLNNLTNFCLNGNNSEFIFSDLGHFRLDNCNHIILKNLIVDWDWDKERLASLARAIEIGNDNEYIIFEFFELESIDLSINFYNMNQYDSIKLTPGCENGQEFWNDKLIIKKREKCEKANQIKIYPQDGSFPNLKQDDVFLVRHTERRGAVFLANDCSHTTYYNITIYSSPGGCFIIKGETHHFKLDFCKIGLRPNSNRRMSADADGFHIIQSKGYNIVENCDFSFMGDDGLNIHDCMGFVLKRQDDYTLVLENGSVGKQGDIYEIRRPDFSKTEDKIELFKVEILEKGCVLTFKEKIPDYICETYMVLNTRFNSSNYIIRNNYFHDHRARGLLLQCSNGLVEGNRLCNIQGAGIYIMMETLRNLWYEGIGVDNLIIQNNLFENCNLNDWTSVIDIMAIIPDKNSDFPVFTNIKIENNTFDEFPSSVMFINKSKNVSIKNNTFNSVNQTINNKFNRGHFYINKSNNISFENNTWLPSKYIAKPGFINNSEAGDGSLYRATSTSLL